MSSECSLVDQTVLMLSSLRVPLSFYLSIQTAVAYHLMMRYLIWCRNIFNEIHDMYVYAVKLAAPYVKLFLSYGSAFVTDSITLIDKLYGRAEGHGPNQAPTFIHRFPRTLVRVLF